MVNEDEGVLCAAPRLGVTERESSGGPARYIHLVPLTSALRIGAFLDQFDNSSREFQKGRDEKSACGSM